MNANIGNLMKVKTTVDSSQIHLKGQIGTVKIITAIGALLYFPDLGYTDYVFLKDLEAIPSTDSSKI